MWLIEVGGVVGAFNVTPILVSALRVTLQVEALPLHTPPCHPAKTIDGSGVTVSVILVPEVNEAEQP